MGERRLSALVSHAKKLRHDLGPQFIRVERGDEQLLVHQSVATMLLAQAPSLAVEFLTWSQATEGLRTGELQRKVLEKDGRVIIIPASTVIEVPGLSLQSFYETLWPVQGRATNGTVSIFPSETERRWGRGKLGDIGALDAIAQEQAGLGNFNRAYRPLTCFGVGVCKLAERGDDTPTVLKRSHSAASEHVKFTTANDRNLLRCYRRDPKELGKRQATNEEHVWFHQEYVGSLRERGEFRVFIACDEAPGRARVVSIAHTKPGGGAIAIHALSPRIFPGDGVAKVEELKEFALFIRQQLLKRLDAKEHYESLLVGVRFDIGISEDERWFVSEVTRPFDADQLASEHLPYPHIDIAEAFGEAFRRYVHGGHVWKTSM